MVNDDATMLVIVLAVAIESVLKMVKVRMIGELDVPKREAVLLS